MQSRINLKSRDKGKKQTKRDENGLSTFTNSLSLFKSGMTIPQIAKIRSMSPSTIENHLARFIPTGEINLTDLVAPAKVEPIKKAILKCGDSEALSPIKQMLGDDYTYGEIRAVLATL